MLDWVSSPEELFNLYRTWHCKNITDPLTRKRFSTALRQTMDTLSCCPAQGWWRRRGLQGWGAAGRGDLAHLVQPTVGQVWAELHTEAQNSTYIFGREKQEHGKGRSAKGRAWWRVTEKIKFSSTVQHGQRRTRGGDFAGCQQWCPFYRQSVVHAHGTVLSNNPDKNFLLLLCT